MTSQSAEQPFREGMRRLAGAVTIVTAGEGDAAVGMTATAVCSLSMDPPRLLACINRFGALFRTLSPNTRFCVNLLPADARSVAERFAGSTAQSGAQRFDPAQWLCEPGFSPRLAKATSAIACTVHSLTVLETHAIVVGSVEGVWNAEEDTAPLVYHQQAFRTLCPLGEDQPQVA